MRETIHDNGRILNLLGGLGKRRGEGCAAMAPAKKEGAIGGGGGVTVRTGNGFFYCMKANIANDVESIPISLQVSSFSICRTANIWFHSVARSSPKSQLSPPPPLIREEVRPPDGDVYRHGRYLERFLVGQALLSPRCASAPRMPRAQARHRDIVEIHQPLGTTIRRLSNHWQTEH